MHADPTLSDQLADAPSAPPQRLWDPEIAANWSLLFTPLFGAYLHMKNWEALGEPGKAARARRWVWASICLLLANACADALETRFNGEPALVRWTTLAFLLAWYFSDARLQVKLVRVQFGTSYCREQWDGVVLTAVVLGSGYLIGKALLAMLLSAVA